MFDSSKYKVTKLRLSWRHCTVFYILNKNSFWPVLFPNLISCLLKQFIELCVGFVKANPRKSEGR